MKAKDDCATDHLVGIDDQVEALMNLLDYDVGCARCLGIHGSGGIGKTTLAKALFDKHISNFDRYCFLRDVRESSHRDGIIFLQKKLLSNILGKTEPMVDIIDIDHGMKVIRKNLHDKKVLIVLDDVDHREQLETLVGKISWLGTGSRVVITTRNKSILESGEKIRLYELKEMNSDQALQLYINHAFKRESPRDDYYDRLSRDIISTIGGLPLVVEVIGSFLHWKDKTVWKDTLEQLRSIAHEDVHRKLKLSYDALNFQQKQIFLDIACFSCHEEEINASYMWKDCNFSPQMEIEVLSSLSLINIRKNGRLWMHDLLKDLGRQIVYEENLDPGKRSRLWMSEEAADMVKTKENKGNIEALSLAGDPTLLIFTDEDFARLPNLRLLELDGGSFIGDYTNLFSKLRWFSWCHCPPDFIATNLFPQNLVVLQLSEFNDANDWEGWSQIKMLHNLKVLQLTRLNMVKIDLSGCSTLERLIIRECQQLVQIDRSIGKLEQLVCLNIEGCDKLKDLPGEIGGLVNLKHLSLSHCSELRELPGSMGELNSLIKLDVSFTSIKELPHSVGNLVNLKSVSLAGCREIRELPYSIGNLESLIELDLSSTRIKVLPHSIGNLKTLNVIKMEYCRLAEFPSATGLAMKLEVIWAVGCSALVGEVSSEIGKLSFLRILNLSYTNIFRLPKTISVLPHLEELILMNCNELEELPLPPTSLTHLLVSSLSLQSIPDLSNLTNLVDLLLSDGREYLWSPPSSLIKTYNLEWIRKLSKLRYLNLFLPNVAVSPTALGSLTRLRELYTSTDLYPEFLMQPPRSAMQGNLMILKLCRSLKKEIQLGGLEQLRHLTVLNCQVLERIIFSQSDLKNLKELELHYCPKLIEIHGLGALETLENLKVEFCSSISRLSDLSRLPKLMELKITCCGNLRVFEGLDKLGCLRLFKVISCRSLEYWTNASDTMIPDECQVVIQYSPKLGETPRVGMSYKDYRDKILGQIKSDLDTPKGGMVYKNYRDKILGQIKSDLDKPDPHTPDPDTPESGMFYKKYRDKILRPIKSDADAPKGGMFFKDYRDKILGPIKSDSDTCAWDSMDKVAEMEEKRHVASIQKDVGTDVQVNHILSLMNIEERERPIIVVIHGEGGIGKTTLAKFIYNQVSCDFNGCSFLTDIKETTQELGGLQLLQTKLISDVLKRELEDVAFVSSGIEFFRDLFCKMRVLIVLDDVENAFHVQKLIGDCFDCFASGSRILVTTRNSVVLEESPQIRTYRVSRLDDDQALQLSRQHASIATASLHSSSELLNYALNAMAGLPLFIEFMAAVFNGTRQDGWSQLQLLSIIRQRGQRVLKRGYRLLDYDQKQIFLDIACFTTGIDGRIAWYLWYNFSFLPSREILTPLAKIGENNEIWMHSMLRRLGREMVRGENLTNPGGRSRLFNHEIALDTIKQKKGTEKVEALCLNFQRHTSDKLTPENFESMPNIRFLQLDHADIAGDFANVLPNLRWLRWRGCPRHLQVTNFHLGNLTILDLSWSKVTKDWEGWGQIKMQNLRVLDLTGCADLLVTPKFSGCQNLAILILERCSHLLKIDHSISDLKCLVSLNLKFCTELSMLPVEVGDLTALKELLMDGTSVQEIPFSIGHLKQLETLTASNCFSLSQLPRTICHLTNISLLSLDGTRIATLPDSIGELVRLKHLSLRDCRQIRKLPNSIGNIGKSLVELDVSGTGVSKFPDSIKNLHNLKVLRMDSCFFREFPPDIGELTSLEEIHASWCRSLEGGIPSGIGKLHNLRILRLRYSSITSIPVEIHQLPNLQTLDLLHSNKLEELPTPPPSKRIRL